MVENLKLLFDAIAEFFKMLSTLVEPIIKIMDIVKKLFHKKEDKTNKKVTE